MKGNIASKCLSVVLAVLLILLPLSTAGCGADQIIAGLETADAVDVAAIGILSPVNPNMATALSTVDADLKTVIKAYQDYEAAAPSGKATAGELVRATVSTIQGNLSAILADVGVKNPGLLRDINIAVAVVNSALVIVLSKVSGTTAQALVVGNANLPVVAGAKSASDLKKAWNNAIAVDFPKAKI